MKALSVFSGGLDSMLASELIRGQGIDVLALFFETPFFTSNTAVRSARSMGLPIKVIDITDEHLKMLKAPKFGYGGNMNPCLDCHILMIRKAGGMLQQEGAAFVITGEVLGQRPMSQNRRALDLVEKESGFKGLVLRPLSAALLPVTIPEREGWVDRAGLKGLSGRSRKPQMEMARRLGITDYPSPAGGCLLTDPVFSRRLKDLLCAQPFPRVEEIRLLKVGRHFRTGPRTKVVVGRNRGDNEFIEGTAGDDHVLISAVSVPGPTVLVSGELSPESESLAASMAVSYSDAELGSVIDVRVSGRDMDKVIRAQAREKEVFREYMI